MGDSKLDYSGKDKYKPRLVKHQRQLNEYNVRVGNCPWCMVLMSSSNNHKSEFLCCWKPIVWDESDIKE